MSRHRNGELGVVPFRSGRFFYIGQNWYFSCREGRDQGPFENRETAEFALNSYIEKLAQFSVAKQTTSMPPQPSTS
jgi:hypothetical protein